MTKRKRLPQLSNHANDAILDRVSEHCTQEESEVNRRIEAVRKAINPKAGDDLSNDVYRLAAAYAAAGFWAGYWAAKDPTFLFTE